MLCDGCNKIKDNGEFPDNSFECLTSKCFKCRYLDKIKSDREKLTKSQYNKMMEYRDNNKDSDIQNELWQKFVGMDIGNDVKPFVYGDDTEDLVEVCKEQLIIELSGLKDSMPEQK